MGRLYAVEIVYRGIFQKTLAKNLSRAIVLAAHREGKPGISFGRYGDSPERNGIPAKNFAIVATDDLTLEELLTAGMDRSVVERIVRLVDAAEWKRRQSPPGVRVTTKAFGRAQPR